MKNVFDQKVKQIRELYRLKGKNGILFEHQNNISWLLKGRTFISLASVKATVDVLINDEAVYLIVNNIEARRMLEEEFQDVGLIVKEYSWFDSFMRLEIINSLTDGVFIPDGELENELMKHRLIMADSERNDFIELGRQTASVIVESCFMVERGMSERRVASIMAEKCYERGIEPNILLVAADDRIKQYRHPLPTSKSINNEVMLVLGSRKNGQCVGITRFVAFSDPSFELIHIRDAVSRLNAMLFKETRPGQNVRDIFKGLLDSYRIEGYPEEWKNHHQGGLIGYNPREIKVTFDTNLDVQVGQAYAWNPSINGYKIEDTFLVEEKENIIITRTEGLPYYSLPHKNDNEFYPDILIRRKHY